jgi:L-ascorbate metabolism protein UlaG (beta-lactamase superfamily)
MEIKFLGHSAFSLHDGDVTVLVDPFLTGNPKAAVSADELQADAILLTHGHADHVGDTVAIAKRTGARVQAIVEIANELGEEGLEVIDTNIGGTATFAWGSSRLVQAFHTSTTPKGTVTPAAGLVVEIGGKRIYIVGDSGLFSDLALPGKRGKIDIAIIPIGGHYTMDRFDAVVAAELIGADVVIPCHYNTFPPIEADAQAYKADVEHAGFAQVVVLDPGESYHAK